MHENVPGMAPDEQLAFNHSIQQALLEAAVDGIIVIDRTGVIRLFNRGAEQLFGYPREHVLGQSVNRLMPEPFAARHDSYVNAYLETGQRRIIGIGREVQGMRQNGELFPMRLSIGEAHHRGERFFVGICHDLTDYRLLADEKISVERRYQDLLEGQSELICHFDPELRLTFVNQALLRYHGREEAEMLGHSFLPMIPVEDHHRVFEQLRGLRHAGDRSTYRHRVRLADGRLRWQEWTWSVAEMDGPRIALFQGFGTDITERLEAEERALHLVTHDALTGLANRQFFEGRLRDILQQQEGKSCPDCLSLLLIDIDRFKQLNDNLGHGMGDRFLQIIADRLRSQLQTSDLMARWGNDEFAVLLSGGASRMEVRSRAEALRQVLAEPCLIGDRELLISVSIGASCCPRCTEDAGTLLYQAEIANQQAKREGGNRVTIFHPEMADAGREFFELENRLWRALEGDVLELHYQPKVDMRDGRLVSFEALLRWPDAEKGWISPAQFIPLAEASSLYEPLGEWVIERACRQLADWREQGLPLFGVAINVSPRHFRHPGFSSFLLDTVRRHQLPPELLELEITEGIVMEDSQRTISTLQTLRDHGFSIAIDDFGVGYSSLRYLSELPVSTLKIDQRFVRDMREQRNAAVVAEAIIRLGRTLSLDIVAEGVETPEQCRQLLGYGCHLAQGYLFSRALPAAEVARYMIPGQAFVAASGGGIAVTGTAQPCT